MTFRLNWAFLKIELLYLILNFLKESRKTFICVMIRNKFYISWLLTYFRLAKFRLTTEEATEAIRVHKEWEEERRKEKEEEKEREERGIKYGVK